MIAVPRLLVPGALVLAGGLGLLAARGGWAAAPAASANASPHVALVSTSRESLQSVLVTMPARVQRDPGDGEAAVLLTDALLRSARVDNDAGLAREAERIIRGTLAHDPGDYPARRMLGVVLLAQHRFADALAAARDAAKRNPGDAWNHAVAGDALLELGRYDEAFDAFDELNRRRPDAASYARAAYARELQGDLTGALRLMQMAAEGTGAQDPEAQAWYRAQLGDLHMLAGRLAEAEREYARAEFTFPGHPYARAGRARLLIAHNRLREAYTLLAAGPDTPESWAIRGDLARHLGDTGRAAAAYREAERLEREGWKDEEPQPAALARFLAERGLRVAEALTLAREAAEHRQDIHTLDALAWASFQAGDLAAATDAIGKALRTGTRDPRIRCHAAAIAGAQTAPADAALRCDPLRESVKPAPAVQSASVPRP